MAKDESFAYLARMVCGDSGVQVIFKDDCCPHSDVAAKKIFLPSKANSLSLEKRVELLCYLLHEIGHIKESHPVNDYY